MWVVEMLEESALISDHGATEEGAEAGDAKLWEIQSAWSWMHTRCKNGYQTDCGTSKESRIISKRAMKAWGAVIMEAGGVFASEEKMDKAWRELARMGAEDEEGSAKDEETGEARGLEAENCRLDW